MKHVIEFNQKTSSKWNDDEMMNLYLLKTQCAYLTNVLRWREYVYLSEVYEFLGIRWNPDDDNLCLRPKGIINKPIYEIKNTDGGYVLTINY